MPKGAAAAVEFVCGPEMRLHGYEPEQCTDGSLSDSGLEFLRENDKARASWRSSNEPLEQQLSDEFARYQLLSLPSAGSREMQERYFLFEETYAALGGTLDAPQ